MSAVDTRPIPTAVRAAGGIPTLDDEHVLSVWPNGARISTFDAGQPAVVFDSAGRNVCRTHEPPDWWILPHIGAISTAGCNVVGVWTDGSYVAQEPNGEWFRGWVDGRRSHHVDLEESIACDGSCEAEEEESEIVRRQEGFSHPDRAALAPHTPAEVAS